LMKTTREIRGRKVTGEEALASAQRLINSHFNKPDRARVQIPANMADDDLIVMDFIEESIEYIQKLEEFMKNYPVYAGIVG
jgi:hypothetical protein